MPSFVGAPQTHSQRSRKGKKAWRKNVDVSEVQEGLENAREEIIKGFVASFRRTYTTDISIAEESLRKSLQTLFLPSIPAAQTRSENPINQASR